MTNEEAITNLTMISIAFVNPVTNEQRKLINDTFDLATKALKQMEFTIPETQMFMAALSCMYMVVTDPDTEGATCIDYMTDKLMQYNKDHFGIPIPDRAEPKTYPEDMEQRLLNFIEEYNTNILQKIIEKLISVENRDNMEEDKTT